MNHEISQAEFVEEFRLIKLQLQVRNETIKSHQTMQNKSNHAKQIKPCKTNQTMQKPHVKSQRKIQAMLQWSHTVDTLSSRDAAMVSHCPYIFFTIHECNQANIQVLQITRMRINHAIATKFN